MREVRISRLQSEDDECYGYNPTLVSDPVKISEPLREAYIASRLAATLTRCIMHCLPTSIVGACKIALLDVRHCGCLATVKGIIRPEATIHAVATNRRAFLVKVSKQAGDVKKLLLVGWEDRHAVALWRLTNMIDAQACQDQLYLDIIKAREHIQKILA